MKEGYIKKEDRKNILLLTDDIRVHSGVAQIGREMVLNTCHKFNWVQLAGAIKHPEKGKRLDLSKDTADKVGVEDASVMLYPTDGYGNPDLLRQVVKSENIDAIFLITDPRYFTWLFQMENEIRKDIPIAYLNIWDDYPAPAYNREYYESCDALFGISKQTVNINKIVLGDKANNKVIKYVPHGLDTSIFKPIEDEVGEFTKFKEYIREDKDFVLLFNSRNIRRKQIPDTLLAWKLFLDKLSEKERNEVRFVLHTQPIDENGTDLTAIVDYLFGEDNDSVVFSNNKLSTEQMSYLYNSADGTILLTSNEGWGLALTESLLTGTPIIANTTGGMQDQMRFVDNEGKWFTPSPEIPSNHRGTFKKHGRWALPVFPTNISIQGSVPTPYIFDDRCSAEDAAEQIYNLYKMSSEERKEIGLEGYKWAVGDEAGFTSEKMGENIIEGMEELFSTWQPRKKFEFLSDDDFQPRKLEHSLKY
tara:strand:+ start:1867 stop:3291 length:1425 start_codon:yes stop_codon:yes gene_type:complete